MVQPEQERVQRDARLGRASMNLRELLIGRRSFSAASAALVEVSVPAIDARFAAVSPIAVTGAP